MTKANKIIEEYSLNNPDIFFVQIGAFDGVTGDPIHKLVVKHNWRGVLVEPQKDAFEALVKNYAGHEGLVFENIAIAEHRGSKTFYGVKPVDYDNFNHGQLHSFRPEIVMKHTHMVKGLKERLVTYKVPCLTLSALFSKHNIVNIDLLQIDTEGYDFEVLKQVDFKKVRPAMIHFEHKHLSSKHKLDCNKMLKAQDYQLIEGRFNTLAY